MNLPPSPQFGLLGRSQSPSYEGQLAVLRSNYRSSGSARRAARVVSSVPPLFGRQVALSAIKNDESMEAELESTAALIPDWAAVTTALGSIAAIVGFVAAWLLPGPGPLLVLTCGLIACAIGMHSAERAIEKLTP
jgi:hypothetical protein